MQIIKILIIALFYITISAFPTKAQNCPSSPPPTALNGILHVRLTDGSGLGNRIKKIISYLRYYKPKHLNLYWETKGSVTAPFSDLFAPAWKTELTEFNAPEIINIFPYNETWKHFPNKYQLSYPLKKSSLLKIATLRSQ